MGEYIKYKGNEIKIGTCESLYYTSYQKYAQALQEGQLSSVPGNVPPEAYAKPDSGYRFRFPFLDEDKLPLGDIGSFGYNRGVPVKIEPVKEQETNEEWKTIAGKQLQLEIIQQKLVHREADGKQCLALVVRNLESGDAFRIEEDPAIRKIIRDILSSHILKVASAEDRNFYRKIAFRIRNGFRLELSNKNARQQSTGKQSRIRRRGKGLG